MSNYSELPTIVGQMKRAAIDCWMADQSFLPSHYDNRVYAKWGLIPNFYTRPTKDGRGGGEIATVTDNGFVAQSGGCEAEFDEIRAAIDSLVAKWIGLPDGSQCEGPYSLTNSAAAILGASGTGSAQANGEIGVANNTVHDVIVNRMDGGFRPPFITKYVDRLSVVASGLGAACMILEMTYAAEKEMWSPARKDVVTICDAACQAWATKASDGAAANTAFELAVVGAVVGAVASVATAGAGTVATVAMFSTATALITSATQAILDDAVIKGNTYGQILGSLEETLNQLNDALFKQEDALRTALTTAASTIYGDLPHFDLDSFALGDYPTRDGTMKMNPADAQLVTTSMSSIETELNQASTAIGDAPGASPTPRNSAVGIGAEGPHPAAVELYDLTARCIALTAQEYTRGHGLFDATVTDYFDANAESQATVNQLLADEALNTPVTP